jgi:hypothetical protein
LEQHHSDCISATELERYLQRVVLSSARVICIEPPIADQCCRWWQHNPTPRQKLTLLKQRDNVLPIEQNGQRNSIADRTATGAYP